jgi:hypothetical protein
VMAIDISSHRQGWEVRFSSGVVPRRRGASVALR